jgi:hypothetical protein
VDLQGGWALLGIIIAVDTDLNQQLLAPLLPLMMPAVAGAGGYSSRAAQRIMCLHTGTHWRSPLYTGLLVITKQSTGKRSYQITVLVNVCSEYQYSCTM